MFQSVSSKSLKLSIEQLEEPLLVYRDIGCMGLVPAVSLLTFLMKTKIHKILEFFFSLLLYLINFFPMCTQRKPKEMMKYNVDFFPFVHHKTSTMKTSITWDTLTSSAVVTAELMFKTVNCFNVNCNL